MTTTLDRFWSKVDTTGDCWEWTAVTKPDGYGQFKFNGRMVLAHRFAANAIGSALHVSHTCGNRKCVKPDHLRTAVPDTSTPLERFHAKYVHDAVTDCLIWVGYKHRGGYGNLTVNKRSVLVHRYAYEQFVGPIPEGLVIDHTCRNRACVNPDHLRPLTRAENTFADGSVARAKVNADKTHCIHGHPFDETNTHVDGDGARRCRECRRRRQRVEQARLAHPSNGGKS